MKRLENGEKRWMICDAPAGGCGGGRRRAIEVMIDGRGSAHCPTCGSEMRPAKTKLRAST